MKWLLLSEIRKVALRPVTLLLVGVFLLATLVITWTGQGFGHDQWQLGVNNYTFTQHAGECAGNTGMKLTQCKADAAQYDMPLAVNLLDYSGGIARAAAPGQNPVGAFGWAAGLFGSVPGMLAAFLLAAAAVAAEWERGTAGRLFLAESRVGRVLMAKGLAIWLTLLAAMFLAGVVTAIYDLAYTADAYPLAQFIPHTGQLLAYTARRFLGATVLLGCSTVIGVMAAARWRTRGTVVGAGIVVALAANLGVVWPAAWAWLPGGVLASSMGFTTHTGVWDHLWGQAAPSSAPVAIRVLPTLAIAIVVLTVLKRRHTSQDLV